MLSTAQNTRRALSVLRRSTDEYIAQAELDAAALATARERLVAFYRGEWSRHYERVRGEAPALDAEAFVAALDDTAVALQAAYLADNVHPPGRHAALMRAEADTDYNAVHEQLQQLFGNLVQTLGYEDVYLVDAPTGRVLFTSQKEMDFGTSLLEGPLAGSALGKTFRDARDATRPGDVSFSDFGTYLPSYDQPVAFVASPVHTRDADASLTGVIIFKIAPTRLNEIFAQTARLGRTSEVILVGPDYLPRVDLPRDETGAFSVERAFRAPERARLTSPATRDVFERGAAGVTEIEDYRGQDTLVTYEPVDMLGTTWAMLAKIDAAEAFEPVQQMRRNARTLMSGLIINSTAVALLAVLGALLFALALSRPILRPLRQTVDMLRNIATGEGDLSRRLTVRTRDEVGELTHWFNTFMDKLGLLYGELAQKTKKLEQMRGELETYSGDLEKQIAERLRAEEEIERRQAYYKALIEYAPDIILVLDEQFRAHFVSPSFFRTFGYAHDALEGRDFIELVHPDDRGVIHERRSEGETVPGKPMTAEFRLQHADGTWRYVSVTGTDRRDDATVGGIVLNMRDVTQRKKAEQVLRNYNEELERAVQARTEELEAKQAEVQQALDNLREMQDKVVMNEKLASLGGLTAGIAHEIKNPLNFVNNFAELGPELVEDLLAELEAVAEQIPAKRREAITALARDLEDNARRILTHGKRADSIVRNMLLHSRGRAGEPTPTDVNALLDEYVHLAYHGMRAQNSTFNLEMDLQYDPELPEAEVVPQDIARVFLNIINNACYATQERAQKLAEAGETNGYQPRLTVRTMADEECVTIVIRDNGGGVPASVRERLFTPFYTTKPAGQGTGLGLSISHDIVVQGHGGELELASSEDGHAEFRIRLPRRAARPHTVTT